MADLDALTAAVETHVARFERLVRALKDQIKRGEGNRAGATAEVAQALRDCGVSIQTSGEILALCEAVTYDLGSDDAAQSPEP